MSLPRRRFLLYCGAAAAGLVLAGTGTFELSRRLVLHLSGSCSFCCKARAEVFRLAGVLGSPARICDECVGLVLEILADEGGHPVQSESQASTIMDQADELAALLRQLAADRDAFDAERAEALRNRLEAAIRHPKRHSDFCC